MRKDVRDLVKEVESIGWRDTGKHDPKGLHILEHESGASYRLTANPNDYRTLPNHRRDLEKIAGQKIPTGGKRRKSHKKIETSGFDVEKAKREQESFHRSQDYRDPDNPLVYASATKRESKSIPVDVRFDSLPEERRFAPVTRRKRIKPYKDSLDGKEIPPSTEVFRTTINGKAVDLALCPDNLQDVEGFITTLLEGADVHVSQVERKRAEAERKKRRAQGLRGPKAPAGMGLKIRKWLIEQGYEGVGDRGRFKQSWLDDYFDAHPQERHLAA